MLIFLFSRRYCWVCFATDEDDATAAWVKPCHCRGTTKWVRCVFRRDLCWEYFYNKILYQETVVSNQSIRLTPETRSCIYYTRELEIIGCCQ
ncbi:E3 ubiquitin-protein ligase MARCH5 [Trachymyrmex cornetzi]|uniref:E3 ubiquitin-protein ligase MARCH5 n=1 Tax=Trachymyrmex cornetzi TaxID=471704 RepID=A0A151J089_9HYME|nr:E3 ubiquitin-protein ligase MARCH5 [Trachymyrmex cornetzi]